MQLLDKSPNVTEKIKKKISQGILELDAVTDYNPENWAAFWLKGKGYQVLGDHEKANIEFKASFEIQKENSKSKKSETEFGFFMIEKDNAKKQTNFFTQQQYSNN